MKFFRFSMFVLFSVVLLYTTSCDRRPPRPNVILIVVDTLRQDHLGCYGSPREVSPNIDRLAVDAIRYENAFSQAPWTTPSFASLLTSMYPSTLGVTEKPDRLDDRFVLLSEILTGQGYATGAIISHYFLKSKWNLDQGFDVYDESSIVGHGGVSGQLATRAALDFIDVHREKPFFLLVHYFDPHYDYIEHEEFVFSEDVDYEGPVSSAMEYTELRDMAPDLNRRDLEFLRALYDSEIAFTDAQIGALFDGLSDRGLFDDSLLLFTADHGEEFRERKTIGHGGTLYNELIKVPLIIKYPGSEAGSVVDTNVALIDVYPTILDYLGVTVGHEIAGTSLLVDNPEADTPPHRVFSETDWGQYRAVIDENLKLIYSIGGEWSRCFDISADPEERKDLRRAGGKSRWSARCDSLHDDLLAWMEVVEAGEVSAEAVKITEEEREQLEALGYLD
jgi:arylsulfatase A-like enzyme